MQASQKEVWSVRPRYSLVVSYRSAEEGYIYISIVACSIVCSTVLSIACDVRVVCHSFQVVHSTSVSDCYNSVSDSYRSFQEFLS